MALLLSNVIFGSVCFFKKNTITVGYYIGCQQVGLTPNRYKSVSYDFYITNKCQLFTVSTSMDCDIVAQYPNKMYIKYYDEICNQSTPIETQTITLEDVTIARETDCE